MPARVWLPDVAKYAWLTDWLGSLTSNITFHLFQNNFVISETTTIGDFAEADYSGYAAQSVGPGGAGGGDGYANVPGNKALTDPYVAIFPGNSGSDQTVYGIYCTVDGPAGTGHLVWASNCFDAQGQTSLTGRTISGPSDVVAILLQMRFWEYTQDQGEVPIFALTGIPTLILITTAFDVTVTALNRDRSTNVFYAGTVQVHSTDSAGSVPVAGTLAGGVGTFNVQLNSSGFYYVTALDMVTPSISTSGGPVEVQT